MTSYETIPFRYALAGYDFETGKHTLQALNPEQAKRTLDVKQTQSTATNQITYEGRLYHTAAWKDHQTSLMGVFQMMEKTYGPRDIEWYAATQYDLLYAGNLRLQGPLLH